jgi:hypothetical protein
MIRLASEALTALLSTSGQSTIELSMPGGYRMPPHFHPTDERVEVKQGTLLTRSSPRPDSTYRFARYLLASCTLAA